MSDRIEYKYKSYGGYITEVSKKEEEYKFDLKQALKDGGYVSKDGVWNSIMQDTDGKLYRVAVETIVVNKDRVFCQVKKNNTLKFPGGSTEKGLTYEEQARNELHEEARINVRNITYTGKIHKDSNCSWKGQLPVMYDGRISYIYIAVYDSKYTGYINKADRDDLVYKGKWNKITDILQYANPEQKEVLENYLAGEYISKGIAPPDNKKNESISNNNTIVHKQKENFDMKTEDTKFKFYKNVQKAMSEEAIAADTEDDITTYDYPIPDIVPYYTPSDLLVMGVFNEDKDNNFYGVKSTMESKEWFDQYLATGYPGEGYLSKLQKLFEEYELSPTLENKQRILEFGWNPNVKINPNIEKRMRLVRKFLMEQYGVTVVDCTNFFD